MAKQSKMSDWTQVSGDISWEDYGAVWARKHCDGVWFALRFDNMEDCCGRDATYLYHCDVLLVDLVSLPNEELQSALTCCGLDLEDVDLEHRELALVDCCIQYGSYAPLDAVTGDSYPLRVRAEARRIADTLMRDSYALDNALDRPVNMLGSTARDFSKGDILAGLRRYQESGESGDPAKDLMTKISGSVVKTVKQSDLSGECFSIQVFGHAYCESCEYYGTNECGGENILKTKMNEKGKEVSKQGL